MVESVIQVRKKPSGKVKELRFRMHGSLQHDTKDCKKVTFCRAVAHSLNHHSATFWRYLGRNLWNFFTTSNGLIKWSCWNDWTANKHHQWDWLEDRFLKNSPNQDWTHQTNDDKGCTVEAYTALSACMCVCINSIHQQMGYKFAKRPAKWH